MTAPDPAAPGWTDWPRRALACQQPFRDRVAGVGLVAACCTWRAADLPGRSPLPLLGSALLVQRPVEALWTVAAVWLVLGPLEVAVGSRWLLAVAALGHAAPTVLVDLCWLAGGRSGSELAGLDVGTSGVIVTAAAALAVATSSLAVAAVLAACLAVDIAVAPGLATAEHLVAVAVGAIVAMAWSRRRRGIRPDRGPLDLLERRGAG